jgi:cytochrome c551/c552
VGDKASWAVSIKKGYDTLVQHAINGIQEAGKVMPPKGGNPELTDIEVQRAVVYMTNRSGANFKEPPAPSATASAAAAPAATAPSAPSMAASAPATAGAGVASPTSKAAASPGSAAAGTTASAKAAGPLDVASAQAMMQKDACSACHAVNKKIVGPAYQDVAAKYKGDAGALARLTQKVKTGGSGVWGPIPMPPNTQVPDGDITALVSWILTLK